MKRAIIFFAGMFSFFILASNSVWAIEYGMLGGKPANPDPKVENSSSWFIYSISAGESKEDAIEIMNLFENELDVLVYAADTIKSSGGGFALKQFSEKNEGVGSWVKFYPDAVPEQFKALFEKKESKIPEFCKTSREEMQEEFGKTEVTDETFRVFEDWCKGTEAIERKFSSKERAKIPFIITVPEGADVGEHTGGILIQKKIQDDAPSDGGSSVKLTTRVGVRIYETVPGEIVKKIKIDYFKAVANFSEFDFSDWFGGDKKPKEFLLETQVSNLGNVSISHENNIAIKDNIFGKRNEEIKREFQVLKGDKFIANYSWKKPFFGYYSFQSEIKYKNGETEEILKGDMLNMWVIPWREISLLALLAALVCLGIYAWKKRQKKLYGGVGWAEYVVKKDDTVAKLSMDSGIDWSVLVKTNKLKAPYMLEAGKIILVPRSPEADFAEDFSDVEEEEITSLGKNEEKKDILDDSGVIAPTPTIDGVRKEETVKDSASPKSSTADMKAAAIKAEKIVKVEKILGTKKEESEYLPAEEKSAMPSVKLLLVIGVGIAVVTALAVWSAMYFYYNAVKKEEAKVSISTMVAESAPAPEKEPEQAVEKAQQTQEVATEKRQKSELKVTILNGGAVAGSAGKVKELFEKEGYVSVGAGNAEKDDHEGVEVNYAEGLGEYAKELADILEKAYPGTDVSVKEGLPEGAEELAVVLGK